MIAKMRKKQVNFIPKYTQVALASLPIMISTLSEFVEDQVMFNRVKISLHHHAISLTDHIHPHCAILADFWRTPVKAKPVLGAIMDPVLFKNQIWLTIYLRLHPTAVVLNHSRALSADVVQLRCRCVARTVSDTGTVVTECVSNKFVSSTLRHYSAGT